eukprot:12096697-Ditylum_brightwellii.AAC.1
MQEYPLFASTLTKEQCITIEAPALVTAIQHTELPSNFPRPVLEGPAHALGMDSPTLYSTSLCWK